MRRSRLPAIVLAAFVLASSAGASGVPLEKRLARALAVPHVSRARTAALVFDLQTGTTLYSEHDSLPLVPASNEKLAVTYAALVGLGPEFRIETDVVGRGELDGTVWRGSLVLVGHGDPTLSTRGLAALAAQVRAAGIRSVTGAVLGDESYFDSRRTAPGWKSWFYINESPPLSALTVDRTFFAGRVWRNPALGAALAFRAALRHAGVSVGGGAGTAIAPDDGVPLGSVESPSLTTIIRWMDRVSDNFTAELLLKQLGTLVAGQGTTAAGGSYVAQTLAAAGIPTAGVRVVDGSGLSQLDRVTARELAGILEAAWADADLRPVLLAALPIAGVSGTLAHRMRRLPARGNVLAKTGTTAIASALSGYVRRRYVFSVVQNGHPISTLWARRAQDRFATVLAASATTG